MEIIEKSLKLIHNYLDITENASKLIEQKLWFKDSTENMPPDYQIATLPQAFQKGFGAGQAKLAKQLLEKRNHALRV